MTDDEFVAEAQARSLAKFEAMLNESRFYNICDVNEYLKDVTGAYYSWRNDEYERLSLYHCENWDTMPQELRNELVARTITFVGTAIANYEEHQKKSWWRKLLP